MSRLDYHVMSIRNRLALGIFLEALAWAAMGLGAALLVAILAERIFNRSLGHEWSLLGAASVLTLIGAFIYSMTRRPTEQLAAVKIDQALGLKEKFSTALYARTLSDPFAEASVRDAERAAQEVSLYNQFPLKFPMQWLAAGAIFLAAFLVAQFMPPMQWFSNGPPAQNKMAVSTATPHSDQFVKQMLPTILAPATMPSASDQIRRASSELDKAMHTDEGDDLRNHRSLLSALQDYNKTMVDELKKNEQFQTSMEEQNQMASIENAKDDSTPIGKAQNELKSGNLDAAMNDISAAVDKFDKMSSADQQKMTEQAMNLAKQLSNAANDPKTAEKVTQQLMQMGASQSQSQKMAAMMQQAAQGNKQAQQQMQQMAQQMAQQMNNGQGPNKQQQQQMQSMMAKAQAMMNSQAQSQALASATQQLGLSMAQAHAAQQQKPASGQQSHPGQSPGSQGQGTPNSQNSQNSMSSNGGQSSMAAAQQQMQQQLQQMQANAKDAQAMQAAANAAAQSAADAANGLNGSGNQDANGNDSSNATGQNQSPPGGGGKHPGGNPGWTNQPGKGGGKMGIAMAPASFKQELDPSQDIQSGKILASRYVKAGIDPGKSIAGARNVAESAQQDAPDDIDQDHVPREAQQAEKDYFSAMQHQDGN